MRPSFLRRLSGATVATVALAATAIGVSPASASLAADALFFASPSSSRVVVIAGEHRTVLSAFPTQVVLAGHFTTDAGAQAFLYNPGAGPDALLTVAPDGASVAPLARMPVQGRFQPFVDDFDGNGRDDIFWYAPGSAADYVWYFEADGSHTSTRVSVGGTYRPVTTDIWSSAGGDPAASILWYAPGKAPDAWWRFDGRSITSRPVHIDGTYEPIVANLATVPVGYRGAQILLYDRAGGRSYLWTLDSDTDAIRSDPIATPGAGYTPVPIDAGFEGRTAVLWYGPGPNPETAYLYDTPSAFHRSQPPQVSGSWRVLRDVQGWSAREEVIFLGSGSEGVRLPTPSALTPAFGSFIRLRDLPPNPIAARTSFTPSS